MQRSALSPPPRCCIIALIRHPRCSMAEPGESAKLPDWIGNHLTRYIATDGADGYLWDASLGGGKGMIPTLLLTTVGRKAGRELTMPLIFGRHGSRQRW